MMRVIAMAVVLCVGISALAEDELPKDPKKNAIDVGKTTERIIQNAGVAGKRLGAKDPGEETRKIQEEILKDIDALIKKAQEPPPDQDKESKSNGGQGGMSKMSGGTSNMGSDMSKQPMGNKDGPGTGPPSRKERRERAKQNAGNSGGLAQQPMADPFRPEAKSGMGPMGGSPNRTEPTAAMPRISDAYKEVWGHLPEKMRQEMDLYFRDRFMPRYSELLRQYYSSLAERGAKTGP